MDAKTEDEVIGPYDDFIEAAKYGDLATLRKCLESAELDINQPDDAEHTAFESALSCGYLKVAEVISEDPRFSVNDKKNNPLKLCIHIGCLDLATKLLDAGANPNYRFDGGTSPLLLTLENGYFDLAQKMVDCGAEVNIRNDKGWTPLIWAAVKGDKQIVEFLLKNAADIHVKNNDGWNAAAGAFFKNNQDIADILLEKGAVFGGKLPEAVFMSAYDKGDIDTVKKMIGLGVNVNIKDEGGDTVLVKALKNGDRPVVALLLDNGADPNTLDSDGEPVLFIPCESNDVQTVESLIAKDAAVNLASSLGVSALMHASLSNSIAVAEFLLSQGSNVNHKSETNGNTALIIAASRNFRELVSLLLDNGANKFVANVKSQVAREFGNVGTKKIIDEHI